MPYLSTGGFISKSNRSMDTERVRKFKWSSEMCFWASHEGVNCTGRLTPWLPILLWLSEEKLWCSIPENRKKKKVMFCAFFYDLFKECAWHSSEAKRKGKKIVDLFALFCCFTCNKWHLQACQRTFCRWPCCATRLRILRRVFTTLLGGVPTCLLKLEHTLVIKEC